jgi:hypothetical protein
VASNRTPGKRITRILIVSDRFSPSRKPNRRLEAALERLTVDCSVVQPVGRRRKPKRRSTAA